MLAILSVTFLWAQAAAHADLKNGSIQSDAKSKQALSLPLTWEPSLGNFAFNISTHSSTAQSFFKIGLLLLWNFDQPNARNAFQSALDADQNCAMCFWGIAHSYGPFLNHPLKSVDELRLGRKAALNAATLLSKYRPIYSLKEKVLIEAMSIRYPADPMTGNQTATYQKYAANLRAVREAFGTEPAIRFDPDLMVFDAEAAMVLMCDAGGYHFYEPRGGELPPVERPETKRASALLREALALTGQSHPYAQHLLIHSTEMSNAEAETAVQAAAQLLRNMRGLQNQHLQHMVSHTFFRTGHYHEAVVGNVEAVSSDAAYLHHGLVPYGPGHNSAFLVASAMWGGERAVAYRYAKVMQQIFLKAPGRRDGPDGSMAWSSPMLVAVRFGDWDRVIHLDVKPPGNFSLLWPYGYGIVRHFCLAVAAAHSGRQQEAWLQLEELRQLMPAAAMSGHTLTNLSAIANHTATAVLTLSEGYISLSVQALSKAVEVETGMPYDEPPPWLLPSRECLGQVLLDGGRYAEAEQQFRAALFSFSWHAEPLCGWALFGLRASLLQQESTNTRREEIFNLTRQIDIKWQHSDVPLQSSCSHLAFPTIV